MSYQALFRSPMQALYEVSKFTVYILRTQKSEKSVRVQTSRPCPESPFGSMADQRTPNDVSRGLLSARNFWSTSGTVHFFPLDPPPVGRQRVNMSSECFTRVGQNAPWRGHVKSENLTPPKLQGPCQNHIVTLPKQNRDPAKCTIDPTKTTFDVKIARCNTR
jgi:hypothetical protein